MAHEGLQAEPTEVKISGKKALSFFDTKFIGLVQQEVEGAKFAHFCMEIPWKGKEGKGRTENATIGHWRKEEEEESLLTISAEQPETLKGLLRAVTKFFEEQGK